MDGQPTGTPGARNAPALAIRVAAPLPALTQDILPVREGADVGSLWACEWKPGRGAG